MAWTYDSRADAIDAAALVGYPEAAISRDHDSGAWGFPDIEYDDADEAETEVEEVAESAVEIVGEAPKPGTALVVVGGTGATVDAIAEGDAKAEEAPLFRAVAETGDACVRIEGFVTPAMGKLKIAWIAKKLGLTVVLVDAASGAELARATGEKSPKSAGGGVSSIVRDERGLTERQGIFLDMVMRPEGATNRELVAAGATNGKSSISWQYVTDTITVATKGQFVKTTSFLREERDEKGREVEVKAFRMKELPEVERELALARVKAAMAAKGQAGKPSKSDDGAKLAAD